jgi:hypothetical protein
MQGFKFAKGDVVEVTFYPDTKKVVFRMGSSTYELPFELVAQD